MFAVATCILFEAFAIRQQVPSFVDLLQEYEIDVVEVSDGNLALSRQQKCDYIREFAKTTTLISEIGAGDKHRVHVTPPYKWIEIMQTDRRELKIDN